MTAVQRGSGRQSPVAAGFDVRNPFTGEVVGRAPQATEDDARIAIDRAAAPGLSPDERAAVLDRTADAYERDATAAALLITMEAGICRKQADHEVRRSIVALRAAATEAHRLGAVDWAAAYRPPGETAGRGTPVAELCVVPEPVALAVAVTPFNHPLNQVVHKVAPAVVAGAPVIVKPSDKAPLSALRLAEVLAEAGLPPHALTVVTGRPAAPLVHVLVCDPRVELVSFTGSVAVGRAIARDMAAHGNELVRYVPELGGNAALVVLADADVGLAARIALAAFDNAGQRCTAVNRILVERPAADDFVERLTELAAGLRWGDPFDPATDVGPVIDEHAARRVETAVGAALRAGAQLCLGGTRRGAVMAPTVLDHATPAMDVVRQEMFGPVAPVVRVGSMDECVAIVRADRHRLAGAIVTASEDAARAYATAVRVGQLSWNGPPGYRTEAAPFGGFGESGNGHKEGIVEATRTLLPLRTFYRH